MICVGDFNDTIAESEKVGGNSRTQSQLDVGRKTLLACGLLDLGYHGHPFTWTNRRKGEENI